MNRPTPVDEEYSFHEGVIVSSTDLKGIITYANRKFCEIAGYSREELKGKNHNIVRHPDMPKGAFQAVWQALQSKRSWTGVVKNLRKDGRYYWVYSHITPITKEGVVVGYTAARRPATPNEIEESISLYQAMRKQEEN